MATIDNPAPEARGIAAGAIEALIFDMDGTMVDSMPSHAQSWVTFAARHDIVIDLPELMRRTTGRNGVECMRELFQQADLPAADCLALIQEKEALYRADFGPRFQEVAGFSRFAGMAAGRGLKIGVGTAGDRHNIAFTLGHLKMDPAPLAVVGGDEGLPGKPEPAIFLEVARRIGVPASACIVFEDAPFGIEAARRAGMRAVAICSSHAPEALAGPHVLASVRDFQELIHKDFLGDLHATA